MKILVTLKRVEDPEMSIKIKADGLSIETDQMKYVVNPFDEIAVEEALRIRDKMGGEVIAATVGVQDAQHQLRTALAMGADRGVHVVTGGVALDPLTAATALKTIVQNEKPDLVLLGKQAVDDDMAQTGIILAELLGWGHISFASKEVSLESDDEKNKVPAFKFVDNRLEALREIDGGLEVLSVALPAVVTTELRLNIPRYASLPGIMKAKKKEIKEIPLTQAVESPAAKVQILKFEAPSRRKSGVTVPDVATLVEKLRTEAKVL